MKFLIDISCKLMIACFSFPFFLAQTLNKSAITLTHMFADNTARDAYFVAHPTEKVEQLFIKVGTGYQQYLSGVWSAASPIVAEQLSATNQPITDTGNYFTTDNTNAALQEMGAHKASMSNPHGVTKTQVGLGNVDNTSDANKPVSTAQQTSLNLKANKVQEGWITPTLINGWFAPRSGEPPQYMKDEFGFVHFRGTIQKPTSGVSNVAFTMPTTYRPDINTSFEFSSISTAPRTIACTVFSGNGGVDFAGASGDNWYVISGSHKAL